MLAEKIRSLKKALQRTEEIIEERRQVNGKDLRIFIIHGNNPELAQEEYEKLREKYPEAMIDVGTFGPVIGTHLGDKAIALGVAK